MHEPLETLRGKPEAVTAGWVDWGPTMLYGGDAIGVTNLVLVAIPRKSSMSLKVRLLCRVSSGRRDGTIPNPPKATKKQCVLIIHKEWIV